MRLSKGDAGYGASSLLGSIKSSQRCRFRGRKGGGGVSTKESGVGGCEDAAESAVEAMAQTMVAEKKGSLRVRSFTWRSR